MAVATFHHSGGPTMTRGHRAIGRQGQMFGQRRRRSRLPVLLGLLALIVLPAMVAGRIGASSSEATAAPAVPAPAPGDATALAAGDPDGQQDPATTPFASFDQVTFALPADDVELVGFHEASYASALAFQPIGEAIENANTTKFDPPPADPAGPGYVVLSSRGRPQPATSAVDVVIRDEMPVRSLVDGTVTDVRPYHLYGRYPDTRIEIQPEARPDLRVVVIHVTDVGVAVGDHVVAGETILAGGPNRFPFASHIDRYFPRERWPHVHVEVKSAAAEVPVR